MYLSTAQRGYATATGMLYGSNAILKSIAPLWVWGHEKEKEDVTGRQCENGFEGDLQKEGIERRLLALLRQCSSGVLRHGFVHSRRGRGADDAERNQSVFLPIPLPYQSVGVRGGLCAGVGVLPAQRGDVSPSRDGGWLSAEHAPIQEARA